MKYVFGVDVGGTFIKMGFFDSEGTLIDKWEIPSDKNLSGAQFLSRIAEDVKSRLARANAALSDCMGVGLAVPGPVLPDGSMPRLTNLDWGSLNVREVLSESLPGLRVEAANDANAAALGELWKGAGQGRQSLVMVTLGTGVGGGVVLDGKILTGVTGAGGEIGHIVVNEAETDSCGCGLKGCVEQYAAAPGLIRVTKQRLAESTAPSVLRGRADFSAKDVMDAVKDGDVVADEAFQIMCRMLGKALAGVAVTVNPDLFVIGGGLSKAGSIITDTVSRYYANFAFYAVRETPIVLATLGNDGGICGAARLVCA